MFKNKTQDILEQKKNNLNTYAIQFDKAVSVITRLIDNLVSTNSDIEQTINEINEYQERLDNTLHDCKAAKEKNDKVIEKFKALLSVE